MKRRKDGERILVDGRVAIVHLKPAKTSGLQMIQFEGSNSFFGFQWRPWQELAQCEDAPERVAQ